MKNDERDVDMWSLYVCVCVCLFIFFIYLRYTYTTAAAHAHSLWHLHNQINKVMKLFWNKQLD